MDLSADSGTLPTRITVEGPAGEQELSSIHCEAESGGTILLQLLEFKTHLFEAVEELHIRRGGGVKKQEDVMMVPDIPEQDAETRFEDKLSKLVLEKQELEWEKESLQHQIETVENQHTETLSNVKKQFQAKIRNTEEEKWKYQASAELKDKEINNLKEELRSLQLLKYNLEKKTSELEQKLALQSRSKDSHLNQLGEAEKRFSVLSRQCATIKQAHEKLEQNVNEAMSVNKKLSCANEKQEATIGLLKKELEEVSKQLIKAKMTSVTHDKPHSPTGKEQRVQQLQQKLMMETKMNRKLCEENEAVRTEKQEVIRSLQHAQHLLLSQTQTVSRVELELQTQREQYQALKQEHEMMREKSKAVDDNVAQLMESLAASRTSWEKEKTVFLDRIKNEGQDLQAVKEAYDALHQKHTELSSLAKVQAQQICELKMRESSQILSVSTQIFPTSVEEVRAEEPFIDPIPSSELCSFGSRQYLASSLTKNPDRLEDTGAVTKLVATGANGGQEPLNHDHQSQYKQPLNHSNANNIFSLSSLSGTDTDTNILNTFTCNSNTSGNGPDVVSDLIYTSSLLSDNKLQIGSGVSANVSSLDHMSDYGSVALVIKKKNEEETVAMNENKRGGMEEQNNRKDENTEQWWNREEVLTGDVREGGSTGEKRGTLVTQTTDRADRQEDNKGSAEEAGGTRNPETETRDRVEGEGTDGVEERGKTAAHTSETPETQIPTQTIADTTIEKSNTQWVIDFMDTEPSLAVSEASDCSQSVSVNVVVNDADFSYANKGREISREEQLLPTLNSRNSVNYGPNCVIHKQNLCHDEVQSQDAESVNQLTNNFHQVSEKTTAEEKPCDESAADYPTEFSEPLNRVSTLVTQTDDTVSIQELETNMAPVVCSDASDSKSNMKQEDAKCDTNVGKEDLLVRTLVASHSLSISQKISAQENEQTDDDDDGDSSVYRKSEEQSNVDIQESRTCKTVEELESELESGSFQEYMTNDKIEGTRDAKTPRGETDLKLHKNDESAEAGCSEDYEQHLVKEMLLYNTDESYLHSTKSYRSSFDWDSTARKAAASRTKSDVLALHQFVEETEQSTSWSAGNLRHPSSTIPMFLKSKHNKVPLVITRTSELLNASSVSGTAAFLRRHQQGEWKAEGETCRETTAAETESGASLSICSFPASTSSSALGSSRAPTSAAGRISECDWEPSCSQEREDEQLSLRAQISKIEQFLKTERLCLPKRQRTDN